jgi:tetratricopeptide (TPR) repeat protein
MKIKILSCLMLIFWISNAMSQTTAEGIKQFNYERYQTAVETLQKVTTKDPSQTEAWYWLIRACFAKGEKQLAETSCKAIPENLHTQPLYKVIRGMIELESSDTVQAYSSFQSALGTGRKKDPFIQEAIAEVNIDAEKGNLNYALSLLNEAEKKDKKNPVIAINKGDAYRKLYNGSEAFRNFQEAVELDRSNPEAYYKIGKIYQSQNNESVFTEYYEKAIKADPAFAPVYFQLYYYYYFKDVNKALVYLQKYIANTDQDTKNTYLLTDLYFVSQKYAESVTEAEKLLLAQGSKVKPRIYKLLAYSYHELNDNINAEKNLKHYFEKDADSNYTAKDFELMADISEKNKQPEEAVIWYEKAFLLEKEGKQKSDLVKRMASFYKKNKQYAKQAYWLGQLNDLHTNLTNVDIFNWGIANYNAKNYQMADSVFAIYENKYPDQSFGYYWRAKSNAAIDTAMETGIAIPHYENLIKVGLKDSANANTRKWLIQAYGYIAAFKVNKEKQYDDALACYDKILQLDPGNNDAEKYKGILEKMIETKPADAPKNN